MRILVSYRAIPQSPGWATGDMVVRAFRKLGHEAHAYAKVYGKNEWLEDPISLKSQEWDLLLFMECNDGDGLYGELGSCKAKKKASWYFDMTMNDSYFQMWQSLSKAFDINFSANRNVLDKAKNCLYLPYAADSKLHFRNNSKKTRDVVLVGSDRPERRKLVDGLLKERIQASLVSNVYREDYINTLASSVVSLNDIAGGGSGMLPMRAFEAPAAGSMLLTPANEGAEEIFGQKVFYYNNFEEAAQIAANLAFHRQETTNSIPMLQEFVRENHTYEIRCLEILEKIFETP